jgi:TetR/AcrR family transcriptional regulator
MAGIPLQTFRNISPEKQERITRVALEEFSGKGYQGASINAMVERLGIAKGSIFQYFGDKKGLFFFVFSRSVDMVKDYLRAVRDQTTADDLFTRLEKTLAAGVTFTRRHPQLYALYLRVVFDPRIPLRDQMLSSLREYSRKFLRSLLEDAVGRGEVRGDVDLDTAAFILDAVMDRFLQSQTLRHLDPGRDLPRPPGDDAGPSIAHIVELMRRGLASGEDRRRPSRPGS